MNFITNRLSDIKMTNSDGLRLLFNDILEVVDKIHVEPEVEGNIFYVNFFYVLVFRLSFFKKEEG